VHQYSLHIADAKPGHHAMRRFNESKAQHDPASSSEFLVASFNERDDWFVGEILEKRTCGFRSVGGFFAMSYAVNRCDQDPLWLQQTRW